MRKRFFLTVLALILTSHIFAQKQINSGSFQFVFTDTKNKQIVKIQLESVQKIEESDISNILIVNLFPGEYNLTVHYKFHNVLQTASQKINIESTKRIVCTLNESNLLSFNYKHDNSSMPLTYDPNIVGNVLGMHNNMISSMTGVTTDVQKIDNQNTGTSSSNTSSSHNDKNRHNPGRNEKGQPQPKPISDTDFNNLFNSAKSEKFEDGKIKTIKTSADFHQHFTSDQVKRLANLPTFEDGKLEVAKYLAPKVIDTHNLPLIKDIFTHSSTKDKYLNFLKTIQ